MILLQVNQVSKYFGAELILQKIKMEIQTHDRVALVGRNGAGKSTLLKIITGEISFDEGEIIKPKDVTIGYLEQSTGLHSSCTIWEEMISIFSDIQKMEIDIRALEKQMSNPKVYGDEIEFNRITREYDRLQTEFKERGGFKIESDVRSILSGLQFSEKDWGREIQSLSGGQKTRLALGKLLLTKPDILILDEPTNHLDIATLTWLEGYLSGYAGAVLVVSHDRYFLDKIATHVVELSRTQARRYKGNYSSYLEQRAAEFEYEMKLFEKQQDEIAKLKDFIQKNIVRASTTKQAQSRRKTLEKMDVLNRPDGDEKSANFRFEINKQTGNEILKANDVSVGYDEKVISKGIDFRITRGESIALIGPNGIGKSTLLKTVIEQLPLLGGTLKFGTNIEIGYYDQEQAKLHSRKRVIDELWDDYPTTPEKDIRTLLGHFLFSGDDVLKPVSLLSGGEKARLALAKLHMQKANFLILDEPTNHLDLDSKMVLENALIDFPGTILFVSHDRYFINRVTDKVFEIDGSGCKEYLGDYDYYLWKKNEEIEQFSISSQQTNQSDSYDKLSYTESKEAHKLQRQRQRRLEELERLILENENKQSELKELQFQREVYESTQKSREVQEDLLAVEKQLELDYDEWTRLQEES
ncbi:MAG: ydiF [Bacillales bacterium]|jgi:ATP-binding cassette subfamily F protein 3|nr:ydiF [Bacillales bacterium]